MSTSHSNDTVSSTLETILYREWASLERYVEDMELYLQSENEMFVDWTDKQIKELTPTQEREFYKNNIEEISYQYEELPKILYNSFLVSAYSLLEYHLDIICKKLKEKRQIPITINDLHGNILRRAKLYWLLAKTDFPCDEKTWQEINNYSEVRNCIIHDNSSLKKDNKNLINYANKKGIVSIDTNDPSIVLTKQFCIKAVQTIKNFVIILYNSL